MFLNAGFAVKERRFAGSQTHRNACESFWYWPESSAKPDSAMSCYDGSFGPRKGKYVIYGKYLSAVGSPRAQEHARLS